MAGNPWEDYPQPTDMPAPWEDYQQDGTGDTTEEDWKLADARLPDAGPLSMVSHGIVPALEFVGTAATGAASSITFAAAATVQLLLGKPFDQVKADMEEYTAEYTWLPQGEEGQIVLEAIAEPLMALEEWADEISWDGADGNPFAATLIKTSILGAADLALPSKGTFKANAAARHLKSSAAKIRKTADRLGIKTNIHEMKESVAAAAKNMTPKQRADNIPLLKDALNDAERAAYIRKERAYEIAESSEAYIETRAVRDLGNTLEARLFDEGYDLTHADMKVVRDTLDDMRGTDLGPKGNFSGDSLAVKYNQLELVLKRINKRYKKAGQFAEANKANVIIKKEINKFIANEFDKIATQQGRSVISGDISAVTAWNKAKALNKEWKDNFSADKTIAKFIKEDATPTQFREWLMGAAYMNANKQATGTIARMKNVLGDIHPAIEGIRQDFLFEVAEPLLKPKPNFNQFNANYDVMIRKNPELVKELGLDTGNFRDLVAFSEAAAKLPKAGHDFKIGDLTKGLAVFWQGHSMAKRALRVGYARNILNGMIDLDRLGQKQIIYALAGLRYGEAMFPKGGPLAAQFIAGAAITEIANTQER